MGMTPRAAAPEATASKTASNEGHGVGSASGKSARAASSLKAPISP